MDANPPAAEAAATQPVGRPVDTPLPAPSAQPRPTATAASEAAAAAVAPASTAAVDATEAAEAEAGVSSALPGYELGAVIGVGGFCQVRSAVHVLSGRAVAVKVVAKEKLEDATEAKRIQREVRVLRRLNHGCIIRLFEVVEAPHHIFLVMQLAPKGSLLDYVRRRKRLSEQEAAFYLQQLVAGLHYCHEREVVHRDVKLENILLDSGQGIQIIDFGLAAFFAPDRKLHVHCGSPSYAAPEIVARKAYHGPPVDVWSLGVVLFAMVAGHLPFHASGGNKQELCQKIMAGTYSAPDWLSAGAKDLLARMLTVDPLQRVSLRGVMEHAWVLSAPRWDPPRNVFAVHADAGGGLSVDAQVLAELEKHGYPAASTLRHLANADANHAAASYYLLVEAKAEAEAKLTPKQPWPFPALVLPPKGGAKAAGSANWEPGPTRNSTAPGGAPRASEADSSGTSRPSSGRQRPPSSTGGTPAVAEPVGRMWATHPVAGAPAVAAT